MAQSADELKIIHTRNLATPGRKYYGADEQVYIGTKEGRLRLLSQSETVVFKPTENIAASDVQDAVEEVEESIVDKVANAIVDSANIEVAYDEDTQTLTPDLTDTGVSAGTYGDATNVPQIVVDEKGRVTSVVDIPLVIPPAYIVSVSDTSTIDLTVSGAGDLLGIVKAGSIGPTELASTAVTPNTYGSTTKVGTFTVDADGRITNAADATIAEIVYKACTFDGQGGVITVNSTTSFEVDFTGTIIGWTLLETSNTPVSSSIVLDAWKAAYSAYPPTVANTIFGTKPALSGATKNQSGVLAIAVTQGDIIKVNVDSVTSAIKVKLIFHIVRTA